MSGTVLEFCRETDVTSVPRSVVCSLALAAFCVGVVIAIRIWQEAAVSRAPRRELLTFFVTASGAAILFTVDQMRKEPLTEGPTAFYIGLIAAGLVDEGWPVDRDPVRPLG